jgi:hypothetical protein
LGGRGSTTNLLEYHEVVGQCGDPSEPDDQTHYEQDEPEILAAPIGVRELMFLAAKRIDDHPDVEHEECETEQRHHAPAHHETDAEGGTGGVARPVVAVTLCHRRTRRQRDRGADGNAEQS